MAPAARADPGASDRQRAAAAFDEGVTRYDHAEFAEAARAFLEADRLSPSAVALSNAIGAAKRAGDNLLVARTAEKAIARGDAVVEARAALADAATRLARLELGCEATPCALTLDGEAGGGPQTPAGHAGGEPAGTSLVYVLPGTHRIEARGLGASAGAAAEERVVCVAGATYRITLRPSARGDRGDRAPASSGRLPPVVFILGVGVKAVLGGVTVWSGVDAISSRDALPAAPSRAQENDVLARARRTDYLLLGAGLAGVGSAVLGAWLTDWHRGAPATAGVAPLPGGGAAIAAGGRF
jgi:hypothetical protein